MMYDNLGQYWFYENYRSFSNWTMIFIVEKTCMFTIDISYFLVILPLCLGVQLSSEVAALQGPDHITFVPRRAAIE